MVTLRPYRPDDLEALYEICLLTADSGADASPRHNDRKAVGNIYSAPYAVLEPDYVFVAEDDQGVAGYIVGTPDTRAFEAKLEHSWFPPLRAQYGAIAADALTDADRMRIDGIMHPGINPEEIVALYPAHIHMNLLPRLRGQRLGTGLLERWIGVAKAAGVTGIHLGANASNAGGIAFWTRSGFAPLQDNGRTAWFGMAL